MFEVLVGVYKSIMHGCWSAAFSSIKLYYQSVLLFIIGEDYFENIIRLPLYTNVVTYKIIRLCEQQMAKFI